MNRFLTNAEFEQVIRDMGEPVIITNGGQTTCSWRHADGTLIEELWMDDRLMRRWVNHRELAVVSSSVPSWTVEGKTLVRLNPVLDDMGEL